MANVHEVEIKGAMAFDANGDNEVLKLLGWLSLPTIGFKIEFGNYFYVDNSHGGKTCLYNYEITGKEAVNSGAIRADVVTLARAGIVRTASYRDVENNSGWSHIKVDTRLTLRDPLAGL